MNKKSFAYLFTIGMPPKIVWSGENPNSLATRMAREPKNVILEVNEFIQTSKPGHHMELPTGEFIFCTGDGVVDYGPRD